MAIFCEINSNNKVINISVADDADVVANGGHQSETAANWFQSINPLSDEGVKWVECSEDNSFRGIRASAGFIWDESKNAFYREQDYPSWTLNETTWEWEAPVAFPSGPNTTSDQLDITEWDETAQKWYYIGDNETRYNWDTDTSNWVAA